MQKTIGLALGGGVIRGAAHIGVLKALEDNGIKPGCIAGTSIGAMVAALYGFGKTPEEILELASGMRWHDVSRPVVSSTGLLSNQEMQKILDKNIGDVCIEDSNIPLAFMTTDIETGKAVILKSGKLASAVMASSSIPGFFTPVTIEGCMLVDGAVVESVPVSPLSAMGADIIVAVDLNGKRKYAKPDSIIDVMLNALDIAVDSRTQIQTAKADVLIPLDLSAYSRTDPKNVQALYEEGYKGAEQALPLIKEKLEVFSL